MIEGIMIPKLGCAPPLGALCFVTVAVSLTGCSRDLREPRFDRKPLGEWVRDLGDRKEIVREEAIYALVASGDDGILFAVAALEDPDWLVRRSAIEAAFFLSGKAPGRTVESIALRLEDPDSRVREQAARRLCSMMAAAKESIEDRSLEGEAAQGPHYPIGTGESFPLPEWEHLTPAIPAIVKALEDSAREVRYYAALALIECGPEGENAEESLKRLLEDPALTIRVAAAVGLVRCCGRRSQELPSALMLEAMDEEAIEYRLQYHLALAIASMEGTRAVPVLAKMAGNWSSPNATGLRRGSITALGDLGPLARDAIPALEAAAADEYWKVHARAALAKIRGD